ncbi:hypothetical protein ACFSTC_54855 [Nonomuraea ferruginea]
MPRSLASEDGRLIGNGFVEIGPDDPDYGQWLPESVTEEEAAERWLSLGGGERRAGAGVPGVQGGPGRDLSPPEWGEWAGSLAGAGAARRPGRRQPRSAVGAFHRARRGLDQ